MMHLGIDRSAPKEVSVDSGAAALDRTVREIGVARLVGRINSGVIDPEAGYRALERFMAQEHARPFLSRLSHSLLGRPDTFDLRDP